MTNQFARRHFGEFAIFVALMMGIALCMIERYSNRALADAVDDQRNTSCPSQNRTTQPVEPLSDIDAFSYAIGTQTIGGAYQFTQKPKLVETAEAIQNMGSNILKFAMKPDYFGPHGNVPAKNPAIHTLTELARDEPAHRHVLDMPFAHYLIWTYCFTSRPWGQSFPKEDADKEYAEIYNFTRWLLQTYSGSGKTFYLGNWEGDWMLLGRFDAHADPDPARIQSMIAWLNIRQKAVDDAKRDTPHEKVQVYHYVEVNLVRKRMQGKACVTSDVLPSTHVDFVSYSSYDSLGKSIAVDLPKALDYIESKLPAKPGVEGRRVFIGEYGFPIDHIDAARQDALTRQVMSAAIGWGCPFVLYWEMYNNEVTPTGQQRGFWLINDKGVRQPVYETHHRFLAWAKQYVMATKQRTGAVPTQKDFESAARAHLDCGF